jgi:hypothetical protein
MKLGIMQPYFFPYLGYFQLIALCDTFVIYDDVQYIKRGWINRNRILVNGEPFFVTLPVMKSAQTTAIREMYFGESFEQDKSRILRTIQQEYARAPYFHSVLELLRQCFSCSNRNVAEFLTNCLCRCCNYLQIATPVVTSSPLRIDTETRGQDRIIAINKALRADHYINPIGGVELYNREQFDTEGLQLSFIRARETHYRQFSHVHVPFLSMIDVMMFNSVDDIQGLLQEYDLL